VTDDADALAAIYERATRLDVRDYLRPERAEPLEREIAAPLAALVDDAIERVRRIEDTCDVGEPDPGEWAEHLEPTGTGEPRTPVARALADELWVNVGNLCFTARSELRRAEKILRATPRQHDERLAGCESARRKLRRALIAVLDAVGRAVGRTFPCTADHDAEVEAAVAVRRMYAKFRRSLPACDPGDPAQVRRALRFGAVSIAVMVGSADFAEVRAHDRTLLLGLQTRILAWARAGTADGVGARLYQDLVTAADLLSSINHRQELAAHDRAALARLRAAIASGEPAEVVVARGLPSLRALAGKSAALDDALHAALHGAPAADVIRAIRDALDERDDNRPSVDAA
jgi:hypothetical protein